MGAVELVLRVEGTFRRLYARKRLLPSLRDDDELRQMFLEEARLAGLVRHTNVVPVLDVGVDDEGPYLVMDFVEGVALSRLMNLVRERGEILPIEIALRLAVDVAHGLHAIHETTDHRGGWLGLIHRDLSPQNVLVTSSGNALITDFGIAKAVDRSDHTRAGVIKGKISYTSPEQLRFERVDRRSDLFALGVVLYEAFAGRRLYANRAEAPHDILHTPPPELSDARAGAPSSLSSLVSELLAKDPEDRPATSAIVAQRLERILAEVVLRSRSADVSRYVGDLTAPVREAQARSIKDALERVSPAAGQTRSSIQRAGARAEAAAVVRAPTASRPRLLVLFALAIVAGTLLAGTLAWMISAWHSNVETANGGARYSAPERAPEKARTRRDPSPAFTERPMPQAPEVAGTPGAGRSTKARTTHRLRRPEPPRAPMRGILDERLRWDE